MPNKLVLILLDPLLKIKVLNLIQDFYFLSTVNYLCKSQFSEKYCSYCGDIEYIELKEGD